MARRILGLLATASVAWAGIYPDGHWERSTKITAANADDFVKENVDKGKTVFISWNKVVETFVGNDDVVFGDVSLSSDQVRSINGKEQGAGAGGWPTVRYFNKATGYGGEAYKQKTDQAMCDELGPKNEYMQQLVEEHGGTSLCNIFKTEAGCSDQQKTFIGKWMDKPGDEVQKQWDRLSAMLDKQSSSMKPEALTWAKQRVGIFKQLSKKAAKKEEL